MKIVKFMPNEIIVIDSSGNLLKGRSVDKGDIIFLENIANIDTSKYDMIYFLLGTFAGAYILIKNNKYRYIKCGSGVPIILDYTGTL